MAERTAATVAESSAGDRGGEDDPAMTRDFVRLFFLSVFLLYVEILLIRWISTEIRVFAYFKNLTLIACFFGMGLGCMLSRVRWLRFYLSFPILVVLVGAIVLPNGFGLDLYPSVTRLLGSFNEMPIWNWTNQTVVEGSVLVPAFLALSVLVVLFLMICLAFVPTGALLGRLFDSIDNRIAAYSVNVAGSIAGIWCFSLVSYQSVPPWVWFLVASVVALPIARRARDVAWIIGTTALVMLILLWRPGTAELEVWSPYQRLQVNKRTTQMPDGSVVETGFTVGVNGAFFQHAVNLDPEFLAAYPSFWPGQAALDYMAYNLAYRFSPSPRRVLVVGAGNGNDVAAALRNGAQTVDAVEIDPAIIELGRQHHPEQPYSDPRVQVHIDDARSFFKRTPHTYDLIVFGTLDSHTLTSSFSNIRIDNFVYTVEAFREARELLSDRGVLWVVFAVERPFIEHRIYQMLEEAFESAPTAFTHDHVAPLPHAGGGTTYAIDAGTGVVEERLAGDDRLRRLVSTTQLPPPKYAVELATDDWPYLYLEGRRIPTLFVVVTLAILCVAVLLSRPIAGGIRQMDPTYFMLGAGFLLVEVQAISRMALLFGTTWVVNSIVFTGILVMILIANLIAARVKLPQSPVPLFGLLFASLLVSYLFPLQRLLGLGALPRAFVAIVVMATPVLFAGLIFISIFKSEERPHAALASNLLGAIVGGLSEALSFIIGVNSLGLIAIGFYIVAFMFAKRRAHLGLLSTSS